MLIRLLTMARVCFFFLVANTSQGEDAQIRLLETSSGAQDNQELDEMVIEGVLEPGHQSIQPGGLQSTKRLLQLKIYCRRQPLLLSFLPQRQLPTRPLESLPQHLTCVTDVVVCSSNMRLYS